ncbi:MAG: proline dehydrogenase family protein [Acidobacteriota bacterium]
MIDAVSRALFHALAQVRPLGRLASRYGMARERGFARRFIAGESIDEAVVNVRAVAARGLALTLDYLGESAETAEQADEATREYRRVLDTIVRANIERNVSLKLTQLGLDVDRATAVDNMRRILDPATEHGFFVRIDMEGSAYTEVTLQIFETLWAQGYRNVGVVLQSYLLRTAEDVKRINALGARIRLVKGAYKEPKTVAFQRKADVDEAFVRLMRFLLDEGTSPAIATHDPVMIEETKAYARERGCGPERFEFQMLYGIRRDLQNELAGGGYAVRIYVPFGEQWYPYFMRRLGERPANVAFVLKSLWSER